MQLPSAFDGRLITFRTWDDGRDAVDAWTALARDDAWPSGFLGPISRPRTLPEFREYVATKFGRPPHAIYTVRAAGTGLFLGFTGVHTASAAATELGLSLYSPAVWGGREIQEARLLMLDRVFAAGTAVAFWVALDGNHRSIRSLLSLGAVEVPCARPSRRQFEVDVDGYPAVRARLALIVDGTNPTPWELRRAAG